MKLSTNTTLKSYLPEIWYHLIRVKSTYYKGLSHYYASLAISTKGLGLNHIITLVYSIIFNNIYRIYLENFWDNLEVESLYDDLHDKSKLQANNILLFPSSISSTLNAAQSYFQKQLYEQTLLYDYNILRSEKRFLLGI